MDLDTGRVDFARRSTTGDRSSESLVRFWFANHRRGGLSGNFRSRAHRRCFRLLPRFRPNFRKRKIRLEPEGFCRIMSAAVQSFRKILEIYNKTNTRCSRHAKSQFERFIFFPNNVSWTTAVENSDPMTGRSLTTDI